MGKRREIPQVCASHFPSPPLNLLFYLFVCLFSIFLFVYLFLKMSLCICVFYLLFRLLLSLYVYIFCLLSLAIILSYCLYYIVRLVLFLSFSVCFSLFLYLCPQSIFVPHSHPLSLNHTRVQSYPSLSNAWLNLAYGLIFTVSLAY